MTKLRGVGSVLAWTPTRVFGRLARRGRLTFGGTSHRQPRTRHQHARRVTEDSFDGRLACAKVSPGACFRRAMTPCPYCAKQIRDAAALCPHCGHHLQAPVDATVPMPALSPDA